ncbi:MAG: T9SS type A sorting domain-containing protein [Ignavibacteria bacterium]|nr:T9SS type A sorting domain-containing protein [Ignavibacteria bacterium]
MTVGNVPNGPAKLEIYDMNGNFFVRSVNVTASNGTIEQRVDLGDLPAGSYMASVNTAMGRSDSSSHQGIANSEERTANSE